MLSDLKVTCANTYFLEVSNNIANLFFAYTHSLRSAFFVARGNYEVGADLHPSKKLLVIISYATKTKEELGGYFCDWKT